jgi:hypothetical protein
MPTALTPDDFRRDLSEAEIRAVADDENARRFDDVFWRRMEWGVLLQERGVDPAVLEDSDFDPVAYGIAKRARPPPKIV